MDMEALSQRMPEEAELAGVGRCLLVYYDLTAGAVVDCKYVPWDGGQERVIVPEMDCPTSVASPLVWAVAQDSDTVLTAVPIFRPSSPSEVADIMAVAIRVAEWRAVRVRKICHLPGNGGRMEAAELGNLVPEELGDTCVHVQIEEDEDGTYIATLDEVGDLIATGPSEEAAVAALAEELLEYAKEYYEEFGLYSCTPNRKWHLSFVMRALSLGTPEKVREMMVAGAENGP